MEPLPASFHTIYRQGRFRPEQMPAKQSEHRERFAVACLALALQCDLGFRAEFLRFLGPWSNSMSAADFQVLVDVNNCGDLILESEALGAVVTVECKIGAKLQDNQRPGSGLTGRDELFDTGYGRGIIDGYQSQKKRIYVALQQVAETLNNPRPEDLQCVGKSWHDLLRAHASNLGNSVLAKAFFELLAEFGVRGFASLTTKTRAMKLA